MSQPWGGGEEWGEVGKRRGRERGGGREKKGEREGGEG